MIEGKFLTSHAPNYLSQGLSALSFNLSADDRNASNDFPLKTTNPDGATIGDIGVLLSSLSFIERMLQDMRKSI